MSLISRRSLIQQAGAMVGAGLSTPEAPTRHWLDGASSQEIEAALKRYDPTGQAYRGLCREINRAWRHARAAQRREHRSTNVVVARGRVTKALPPILMRTVAASRREVRVATVAEPFVWMGQEIPAEARVLVDHRLTGVDGVLGALYEVIDTPTKRRVHIWPSPAGVASWEPARLSIPVADHCHEDRG